MTETQTIKPSVIIVENEREFNVILENSVDSVQTDKAICVFCGACPGKNPIYIQAAEELGKQLVAAGYNLVYGGGNSGLMGVVSRATASAGGKVSAIFPKAMSSFAPVNHATNFQVKDMHNRKKLMNVKSLGFITLPGGIGTLEELLEMTSWNQLGIHSKFVGILNINGFYDHLEKQLEVCVEEGFFPKSTKDIIQFSSSISELLDLFMKYDPKDYKPFLNWN